MPDDIEVRGFDTNLLGDFPQIPLPAPVCRLRRNRDWLQDGQRFLPETMWNVPDRQRRNAMLTLRSCHLNGHFENYWEARRAARP